MKLAVFMLFLTLAIGSVRAGSATVGTLSIEIPKDFKVQESHIKDSLGDLEVNRWRAEDGRIIEVLYYASQPKKDRGPVVVAHEEATKVIGQNTTLIETEVFFWSHEKGACRSTSIRRFTLYYRLGTDAKGRIQEVFE